MSRCSLPSDLVRACATALCLAVSGAAAGPEAGNIIQNGSFEVGLQDWQASARSCRVKAGYRYPDDIRVISLDLQAERVRLADAPHGQYVMRFHTPLKAKFGVSTRSYGIEPGRFRVRAWFKGDGGASFGGRALEASSTWRRLDFEIDANPDDGRFGIGIGGQTSGQFMLDGVSVTPLDGPGPTWQVDLGLSVTAADRILFRGDDRALTVRAFSPRAGGGTVTWRIEDGFDQEVLRGALPLQVPAGEVVERIVPLDLPETGHYRVLARFKGDDGLSSYVSELLFAVVPDRELPTSTRTGADSHFGCNMRVRPHLINVARKIGIRWVMCAPPLFTKWFSVEPAPGEWHYWDEQVQMLEDAGIHILGNLADPPWWATDPEWAQRSGNTYSGPWPNPKFPRDWEAWDTYVRNVVAHHHPRIRHWALWNEPDHPTFLKFDADKGETWPTKYMTLLERTYDVVKSLRPDVQLVGGTVTHVAALTTLIEHGAAHHMDVGAFHWASWTPKGYIRNTGEETGLLAPPQANKNSLERCREAMRRQGRMVPLWNTECHMTHAEIETEHATYPPPPRKQTTPLMTRLDAANAVVRQTLAEWAGGVDKTFFWRLDPAGSIRSDCTLLVNDRSPAASLVAYAVMTHVLEGATLEQWEERPLPGGLERTKLWRLTFAKGQQRIRVVWTDTDAPSEVLFAVRGADAVVRDLFGAPCAAAGSMSGVPLEGKVVLRVGRSPFYIVD